MAIIEPIALGAFSFLGIWTTISNEFYPPDWIGFRFASNFHFFLTYKAYFPANLFTILISRTLNEEIFKSDLFDIVPVIRISSPLVTLGRSLFNIVYISPYLQKLKHVQHFQKLIYFFVSSLRTASFNWFSSIVNWWDVLWFLEIVWEWTRAASSWYLIKLDRSIRKVPGRLIGINNSNGITYWPFYICFSKAFSRKPSL